MWFKTKNGYWFQVDSEDAELASDSGWYGRTYSYKRTNGEYGKFHSYIVRHQHPINGKRVVECLHRLIHGVPKGVMCDHKNGDSLDNRRANIRICTYEQNSENQSAQVRNKCGYKGVCRSGSKWKVQIQSGGKHQILGYFNSVKEAAYVYNEAALRLHGPFARFNNIFGG